MIYLRPDLVVYSLTPPCSTEVDGGPCEKDGVTTPSMSACATPGGAMSAVATRQDKKCRRLIALWVSSSAIMCDDDDDDDVCTAAARLGDVVGF
jgi:hypothetical protein